MRVTVLGSGTSSGVPVIGCPCPTCTSDDPLDKRLRTSILVESDDTRIVVDTSADFRQQMLTANVKQLDAVVFTHHHSDHVTGFDDIRAFNFLTGRALPIYTLPETLEALIRMFNYVFTPPQQIGGGIPQIVPHVIDSDEFMVNDLRIIPIPMQHGIMRVNGYRFGNFAYCTDTNYIPEESLERLKGVKVLILDALRYRRHPTHFTIDESIEMAYKIGAERTYFTHIAHQVKHRELSEQLPAGIELAYDGLVLDI
jgi:phosphoribosyl 1,2-cyclic phosphate phosphodiesterase